MTVNVAESAEARLEIYDVRGALVAKQSHRLSSGQNSLFLNTADLATGSHFAKIQIGEKIYYRPFVVLE